MQLKGSALYMAKAAVSLALVGVLVYFLGSSGLMERMGSFSAVSLSAVLLLLLANLGVVSFRLGRLLAHFGIHIPARDISRISISGHLSGLFAFQLFGQVVGRQAGLQRFGVPASMNATVSGYERLVLLVISATASVLGIAWLVGNQAIIDFLGTFPFFEAAATILLALLVNFLVGGSRFERRLLSQIVSFANFRRFSEIFLLTLVAQLLMLAAFVMLAHELHPQLPLLSLFAAAAVVSFAASLPISVNGWGIREAASVFIFGMLGVPGVDAIAISITIGLCSTAIILLSAPSVVWLRRGGEHPAQRDPAPALTSHEHLVKSSSWILGSAIAVLIFFQMHLAVLPGSPPININLADPFALLAVAAVVSDCIFLRRLPGWRVSHLNLGLGLISATFVIGSLIGMMTLGATQWALGSKLFGWLVLLGYLAAGYLVGSNLGRQGVRRMAEIALGTGVVIVLTQSTLHLLAYLGTIDTEVSYNFEGYAGNRNAFGFQLMVCFVLLLGWSRVRSASWFSRWLNLFYALVLLIGLWFCASRSALISVFAILLLASTSHFASKGIKAFVWTLIAAGVIAFAYMKVNGVQLLGIMLDAFSMAYSDQERWFTLRTAFEIWLENPWFGAGLGAYVYKSLGTGGQPLVIHSTPIWILAEFGLVGFIAFGGTFLAILRHAYRHKARDLQAQALFLLLIGFALFSLAHEIFYQRMFWLICGALLAAYRIGTVRSAKDATGD